MRRQGVSDRILDPSIRRSGTKIMEIKVETMEITRDRDIMLEMETTTVTTTSTEVTTVEEMIELVPMFYLKIGKYLLGMVEVVSRELKIF